MTNRLLLATLVALGAFNSLLCILVISRENSNASSVLSLKDATRQQHDEADLRLAGLQTTLEQTRQDLEDTRQRLRQADTDSRKLRADLDRAAKGLAYFQSLPWLKGLSPTQTPWASDIQKLKGDLEKLRVQPPPLNPNPIPNPIPKKP